MRTNIYREAAQAAALDQVAQARRISRAELVRELIDRGISETVSSDLEADLAAIDASFGVLDGDEALNVDARGPDDRSRHLQSVASRRVVRR